MLQNKKIDLIKIDVEGAEYEFFENTDIEQLSKNVIGIVLEIHNTGDVKSGLTEIIIQVLKYAHVVK